MLGLLIFMFLGHRYLLGAFCCWVGEGGEVRCLGCALARARGSCYQRVTCHFFLLIGGRFNKARKQTLPATPQCRLPPSCCCCLRASASGIGGLDFNGGLSPQNCFTNGQIIANLVIRIKCKYDKLGGVNFWVHCASGNDL